MARKCTHPLMSSVTLEESAQDWALPFPSTGEEVSKAGWNTTASRTRTKWAHQSLQSVEHEVSRNSHFSPRRGNIFLPPIASVSNKIFNFATDYIGKTGRVMLLYLFTSQFLVWDQYLQKRLLTEVEARGAAECTEETVTAEIMSEESAGFSPSLVFWNKTQHY